MEGKSNVTLLWGLKDYPVADAAISAPYEKGLCK